MKLNNIEIVMPEDFKITNEKLSIKERTRSGRLVEDIVAIKRIFNLSYKGITRDNMQVFFDVQQLGNKVVFEYTDNGIVRSAYVKIGSIPRMYNPYHDIINVKVAIVLEEV